jgi:predicted Zn-dependent protease
MRIALPSFALPATLAAAVLVGCGSVMVNPVTGQAERSVMDEPAEIAEGQKGHEQVMKQYGAYPDAKLQAYVNALGQRLASQSHRAQLTWHFTVLDSPEINAFALPGGYVYVPRGIMAYLDSEADLAGVIGHEIGHVTARHGAQRATQQQNAGMGVMLASVLGAVLETQGIRGAQQVATNATQSLASGYIASYGRDQELQADGLGAEYLSRSHYNPANMVDVITVLKNQERYAADRAKAAGKPASTAPNWLASHPSNDSRLEQIRQIAAQYPGPAQGHYADDGRTRYLQAISGMGFGDSAEQGITRGRHFYHAGLGFALSAPEGWQVRNSPDAVMLVNTEGSAGVILRPVPQKAGPSHTQVVRQLLAPTQAQAASLQINGLAASRFRGQRRNSEGQEQAFQATVVDGPMGHQYLLMPVARDAGVLTRNQDPLQAAEMSFRPMTEADRAAAKPWRIQTMPYPSGGFAQLGKNSPLGEASDQQLRLINGFYGGGEPKLGELIKVVVQR